MKAKSAGDGVAADALSGSKRRYPKQAGSQISATMPGSGLKQTNVTDDDHHRRKANPEMLVGVSPVMIGVCALAVSLYEAGLMREQQRAAVLPILELSRSYNPQVTWDGALRAFSGFICRVIGDA